MYFDVSRFSLEGSGPGGIRSGWDQGAKAPEKFCGGVCFSLGLSVCLFYALTLIAVLVVHQS